jgi:hypothetical protein
MKNNQKIIEKYKNNSNFKAIIDWQTKIDFLNSQCKAISKINKFPIFPIVAFILMAQSIEFELKQLITSLDLYSNVNNIYKGNKIWIKVRAPKDINDERLMLGGLIREIKKISYYRIDKQQDLNNFLKIRNKFTHNLFDVENMDNLIKEAAWGIKLADKISKDIKEAKTFLKN